jgi:hypothetical protein
MISERKVAVNVVCDNSVTIATSGDPITWNLDSGGAFGSVDLNTESI